MLLRNRLNNPRVLMTTGMSCFLVGLLGQYLAFPPGDFLRGLVFGLSTVLIGMSIVFNILALVLRRQQRNGNCGRRRRGLEPWTAGPARRW